VGSRASAAVQLARADRLTASIWKLSDETHATVLALIDDLLAMDCRAETLLRKTAPGACTQPRRDDPTQSVLSAHAR
jgi:hypothetical protein